MTPSLANTTDCDDCAAFEGWWQVDQVSPCSYEGIFDNPSTCDPASGTASEILVRVRIVPGGDTVDVHAAIYLLDDVTDAETLVAEWLGQVPYVVTIDCDFNDFEIFGLNDGICEIRGYSAFLSSTF